MPDQVFTTIDCTAGASEDIGLHLCLAPHMHVHTNHLQNISWMRIRFYGDHVYGTAANPRTHGVVTVLAWAENSFGISCKRDEISRQEIRRDVRSLLDLSSSDTDSYVLHENMSSREKFPSRSTSARHHSSLPMESRGWETDVWIIQRLRDSRRLIYSPYYSQYPLDAGWELKYQEKRE